LELGTAVATILLVEDDEQVRVLAESFLQTAGHSTLSAGSSEQALALLATDDPVDLLFVDVRLQEDAEAGFSLAKKAIELRPDLKILYTSAQGLTDGMTALFVPNSAYLPKPYTVEQLGTMLSMKFDLRALSAPNAA
jgi:two-component system cell cycle sensor histidine kinase/response regulator CckA